MQESIPWKGKQYFSRALSDSRSYIHFKVKVGKAEYIEPQSTKYNQTKSPEQTQRITQKLRRLKFPN